MRLVTTALLALTIVACGGAAAPTVPPQTTPPTATVQPRPATTTPARSTVADPVEAEAREHCPDRVESFYEGCVAAWTDLVFGFPDTRLVLCVWPDGHSLVAEPDTEGAGREVGDDCTNSWGTGTLTRIVNEGA